MKIQGRKIEGPNVETVVIPRGNGEPIVFQVQAILSYEELDTLLPRPKPSMKLMRGGKRTADVDSPTFKAAVEQYATRRMAYIILKSLQATEGLEWEKVDMSNPTTWPLFEDELCESGFSVGEVSTIISACVQVNALDEEKINKAREDFLASQETPQEESSSPSSEQSGTPSGGPVSVS